MSMGAFSQSPGSGRGCPVTASPLAIAWCMPAISGRHDVCASIHALTGGVPQTSTISESRRKGIQARATRPDGQPLRRRRSSAHGSIGASAASSSCGNRHSTFGLQNRSRTTPATRLATAETMSTSSNPT